MKKILFVFFLITYLYITPNLFSYAPYTHYYFKDKNIFLGRLDRGYLLSNGSLAVAGIGNLQDNKGNVIPRSSVLLFATTSGDTNLLTIRWKYSVPQGIEGNFSDVALLDIDGDGLLEFCGILNITELKKGVPDNWLYIFRPSGTSFEKEPWFTKSYRDRFPVRPRPAQLLSADVDSDGNEELIVSFYGPYKGVSILDYVEKESAGDIIIKNTISGLEQFNSILPFKALIGVVPGSKNRAVLTIVGGTEALKISFLDLGTGDVIKEYDVEDIGASDILMEKVASGDVNGDGISEIIMPLKSGGAFIFYFNGTDSLKHGLLFPDIVRINSICIADFNFNGIDEIVINYGDIPKLVRYEYDEIGNVYDLSSYRKTLYSEELFVNFKFLNIKPVMNFRKGKTGQAVVSFNNYVSNRHGVLIWNLGEIMQEDLSRQTEQSIELWEKPIVSGQDTSKEKLSLHTGKSRKKITVKKPDILLHPGENMRYTLDIPGFNFSNLKNLQININSPNGMIFDLSTQTFYWTPADTQLGWYEVNAFFSWDNGSVEEHFTIYVNSPPEVRTILPERDIIQIGETFRKKIDVVDGNYDSQIFFDLIKHPEGAAINDNGEIVWKPDKSQKDWYDFILQVTDGYDSTMLSFSLFVNHPVEIVSTAPSIAYLGEQYVYDIKFTDKNEGFFTGRYDYIPRIDNWENIAVVEIPISQPVFITRMKTYAEKFRQMIHTNSFKSNYQKSSVEGIKDVLVDRDKLVFLVEKDKLDKFSSSKLISAFCRILNLPQPEHSDWTVKSLYDFDLKNAPEGMSMDYWGEISWVPNKFQCGYQEFSIIVSDGYFADEENVRVYVNAPPLIISKPNTIAFVGEKWEYRVKVRDLNEDAKLEFRLIDPPEGVDITKDGLITWIPTDKQLNYKSFKVEVRDGYQKQEQNIKVYVNMPPTVLSKPEPVGMVGIKYEYKLDAEDANGNPIVYRVVRIPKYAEFDPVTGILTWTPKASQIGTNHVIFEILDNYGGKTIHEFDIRVFKNPTKSIFSYVKDVALVLSLLGLLYFALMG